MNICKKFLVVFVLALGLCLSLTATAFARSLDSIYDEVKSKYPNDIKKLKDNGASERSIEGFLNEIGDELGSGNFDEDEIEEEVGWILLDMYLDDKYPDVFTAVKKGWGLSGDQLLDEFAENGARGVYRLLPDSLQKIGDLVKDRLTDSQQPGNPGGPGGGGAIPPVVKLPNVPEGAVLDSAIIAEQLEKNLSVLSFNMAKDYSILEIIADDLEKIFAANKELQVRNSTGDVILTLLPGTVEIGEDNNLKFNISKIDATESETLAKALPGDVRLTGEVFDLDIRKISNESESKVNFAKAIKVALSYRSVADTINEDCLAIFRYNEQTKKWEFVGGKVNKNDKTVEWQANHFSKYAIMQLEVKSFADILGHWAQKDIEFLASRNLVGGVALNVFDPERPVNRAEFASMLIKLLNINTDYVQKSKFTDVTLDVWYGKAVNAAADYGLVAGAGTDVFEPERTITRQEMMAMVSRALKFKGIDTGLNEAVIEARLAMYSDGAQVAPWAKEVVVIAINHGIISGRTPTQLAPLENTTRAEASVIVKRIYNKIN